MSTFSSLCTDIIDFGTKNSNPRTEPITKITIHHMAGVTTGAKCAQMHRNGNAASANYYIGNAGDICGGVSEDRRAWTSSSGWNDQRAITIECSNSATGNPWPVSDAAYKSTIRLCADICKRYGITPHYTGEKGGSLTLHCMFAATACPGPTWKGYHSTGKVEQDIMAAMGEQPQPKPQPQDNEGRIWDFLLAKIGNEYGVAGMMGNLQAESGLRPNNLQNTFEKKLGMTDDQYTAAVDIGAYKNFVRDGAGYGLAQWTYWSRKENLYNSKGSASIGDLDMQLRFLWQELSTGYKSVLNGLKGATSVYDATVIVLTQYERPADQSEAVKQKRTSYSQYFYDKYATGVQPTPAPFKSYIVRITADELNVREGPGTQYPIVQTVRRGEAFTIVQQEDNWGFLKSGVGWICLDYTQKV